MNNILIECNNKGCYSKDYHKVDLGTAKNPTQKDIDEAKVICTKCFKPISNLSKYLIKNLIQQKQIFVQIKSSFRLKCKHCGKDDCPVLLNTEKGQMVACDHCKTVDSHLTKYFLEALKKDEKIRVYEVSLVGDTTEYKLVRDYALDIGLENSVKHEEVVYDPHKNSRIPKNSILNARTENRSIAPPEPTSNETFGVPSEPLGKINAEKAKRDSLPTIADTMERLKIKTFNPDDN